MIVESISSRNATVPLFDAVEIFSHLDPHGYQPDSHPSLRFNLTASTVVIRVILTLFVGSHQMSKYRSVADVKARFSEYIRAAEHGDPVVITRHGRAVAALVGSEELQTLERLRSAGPEGGLASVAGGWEDSDDLIRILETSPRVGSRNGPALD